MFDAGPAGFCKGNFYHGYITAKNSLTVAAIYTTEVCVSDRTAIVRTLSPSNMTMAVPDNRRVADGARHNRRSSTERPVEYQGYVMPP